MKKLFVLIPLIVIVAIITTCGGEEEVENYYPLSVGNIWNYGITMTVEVPGTTYTYTGDLQDEITNETQHTNGANVFEWVGALTLDGFSSTDTFYLQETDTAVFMYTSLVDTDPDNHLELPIEEGNTWIVNSTMTAVVLGRADISVPAGNYEDCWEIAYIYLGDTMYVYLADGVGEVRGYIIETEADTTVALVEVLESATIQ